MKYTTRNYIITSICLVVVCAIILQQWSKTTIERFEMPKSQTAACLICRFPNKIWLDFLKTFTKYTVFVVVDEDKDISTFRADYPTITFVQISADECRKQGYMNINFIVNKDCTGWEKGLYYFTKKNPYEHVWFFEDDVFFRSESDLLKIDQQYSFQDLLSAPQKSRMELGEWHWSRITVTHPDPHYAAMCCAIRVSQALLKQLEKVAEKHKTLYFLEALFPTEARDLTWAEPAELKTITYGDKHTQFIPGNIYHPVKDIDSHSKIRYELT